jgi:hypothetical protein
MVGDVRPGIKRMGATTWECVAPIHFSWLLSSPQQPLETEDPPTVSLAPQYTSQRLCRAREFLARFCIAVFAVNLVRSPIFAHDSYEKLCRNFSPLRVEILLLGEPTELRVRHESH